MNKIQKLENQYKRLHDRFKRLENKYYHWQHYFKLKKKKFDARYSSRRELAHQMDDMRRILKNLRIKQVKGYAGSNLKCRERHIVVMSTNDVKRLQLFIKTKHFQGRKTRKRNGELMNFTSKEKNKLRYLLKKDWRRQNETKKD